MSPFDDVWHTLSLPERLARLAPATVPLPTVDALMAIALDPKQSDFIGDIPDTTAFALSMYCGDVAVRIAEQWEDETGSTTPLPLCLLVEFRRALEEKAWERVHERWAERDEEDTQ